MKTLQEVFSKIDNAYLYRISRYGIEIKNETFNRRCLCKGLSEEFGKELVYKVIKTKDYKTYEHTIQVILSSDRVRDTKETIYELIELNDWS